MTVFYVGADVHQASTTLVVLDAKGKMIKQTVLRTTPDGLIRELKALGGDVKFAVEESNHARWIYDALTPVVSDLIVCDPKRNKFGDEVRKGDFIDAKGLAELNYMGKLKPVYHGDAVHSALKELVKTHIRCDKRRTSAMNAIRGVFANDGHWKESSEMFLLERREDWLSRVDNPGRVSRLRTLYAEFDTMTALKADAQKQMIKAARRKDGWRSVHSIPGIADVRTSHILGIVGSPHRFRTKRQLWSYSGFGVVHYDTDEYDKNLQKKRRSKTLGLNKNRSAILKNAFKGAAQSALMNPNTYPEIASYHLRQTEKVGGELAAVAVARKLISITLTTWKREEEYDPNKASW